MHLMVGILDSLIEVLTRTSHWKLLDAAARLVELLMSFPTSTISKMGAYVLWTKSRASASDSTCV